MTEDQEEALMQEFQDMLARARQGQMTNREARVAVDQFREVMENNDEGARLPVNVLVPRKKK